MSTVAQPPRPAMELKPATRPMPLRRRARLATLRVRELASIGSALLHTGHPYMAHIVPMRRCNLACTYCNEFDQTTPTPCRSPKWSAASTSSAAWAPPSSPSPAASPCSTRTSTRVIARIRKTGAMAGMITNGYLLMPGPH